MRVEVVRLFLTDFGVRAVSSSTFRWPAGLFSVIRAMEGFTAMLFNAGLIIDGLVSLSFSAHLWRVSRQLAGVMYAVGGLSFAGASLVPIWQGALLHFGVSGRSSGCGNFPPTGNRVCGGVMTP